MFSETIQEYRVIPRALVRLPNLHDGSRHNGKMSAAAGNIAGRRLSTFKKRKKKCNLSFALASGDPIEAGAAE